MSRAQAVMQQLKDARLWTGETAAEVPALSSGYAPLDRALPGRGFPIGALTELLADTPEMGLSLAAPLLSTLTQQGKTVALVQPPLIPYAPGLEQAGIRLERLLWVKSRGTDDSWWSAEQLLRCKAIGGVLLWTGAANDRQLRRLQLAAESSTAIGILFRASREARNGSPAALRLSLQPRRDHLRVGIQKCRGGTAGASLDTRPLGATRDERVSEIQTTNIRPSRVACEAGISRDMPLRGYSG